MVAAVVGAAVAAGCSSEESGTVEDASQATPTPHSQPGDDGTVSVAESGFTALKPIDYGVTYAVVLNNSSAQDAMIQAQVSVAFLDGDGEPIELVDAPGSSVVEQTSGGALPGGEAVVSGLAYPAEKPAELKVTLGEAQWYPQDDHPDLGAITTADPKVAVTDKQVTVTFSADSSFKSDKADIAVRAVFRNAVGDIVAGTQPEDATVMDFPTGESTGEIVTQRSALPPDVDEDTIEVYAG